MQLQNIVSIIGMATGLAGLYIGLHEYIRQGRQKRFECYRGFQEQISNMRFRIISLNSLRMAIPHIMIVYGWGERWYNKKNDKNIKQYGIKMKHQTIGIGLPIIAVPQNDRI